MLYLHCGWPRTSTSSLQAALFECRRELAAAGLEYPERWLSAEYPTHHELTEILGGWLRGHDKPFAEIESFLAARSDRSVLFSAEVLSYWLHPDQKQAAFQGLLTALRASTEMRCIWTLRRMDELIGSLFLLQLSLGAELPPAEAYFDRSGELDVRFAGMRRAHEAVQSDAAYVKYDASGSHLDELLPAIGVPERVRTEVLTALAHTPRLNPSMTQKQAVALVHLDILAGRAGVAIDREALRRAVYRGELSFARDRRCEPVAADVKLHLHEQALIVAERQGFGPYVEFFAEAEIEATAPLPLDPDQITADDLERVLAVAAVPSAFGNARDCG